MQLSLSQPVSEGPLPLLLLSSLLLSGNVVSVPECSLIDGRCEEFLEELFEQAISKSQNIQNKAAEMNHEFFSNDFTSQRFQKFAEQIIRGENIIGRCHTIALGAPKNIRQAKNTQPQVLLNLTLSLVGAWNGPLNYLLIKLPGMQGAPVAILSVAKEMKQTMEELLDDIHQLFRKVYPEVQANGDYPEWSELASLKELEHSRFLALYKLAHCLRLETHMVTKYLKVLKCRIIYNNNCPQGDL